MPFAKLWILFFLFLQFLTIQIEHSFNRNLNKITPFIPVVLLEKALFCFCLYSQITKQVQLLVLTMHPIGTYKKIWTNR